MTTKELLLQAIEECSAIYGDNVLYAPCIDEIDKNILIIDEDFVFNIDEINVALSDDKKIFVITDDSGVPFSIVPLYPKTHENDR